MQDISFLIFVIVPLQIMTMLAYFPFAKKFNLIDIPNERSSHSKVTYRGGGIIIPISLLFYFVFFKFQYPYLVMAVTVASIVSIYDDFKGANIFVRLFVQTVAVALILMQINPVQNINPLLVVLITTLCIACVNAYNFMDGINGITGLYTLTIYETIYFYDYVIQDFIDGNLILVLTFGLIIFGFFNFRSKAKVFAGDVGSVSLGLIAVFLVLFLIFKNQSIIFLSTLIIYGVDSGLTICLRLIKGENILKPHRIHLFQDLVHIKKMTHLTVAFIYAFLQLIINLGMFISIKFDIGKEYYFFYVLFLACCSYIILKYYIYRDYNKEIA